jgi:hypothetical protein
VMPDGATFAFHDLAPGEGSFRDAVLGGLSESPKSLPCKFFYDERGSALFEAICEVPEYYLTRTEIAILEAYAPTIAERIGPHCRLIELGSGASRRSISRANTCAMLPQRSPPISPTSKSSRSAPITPGRSSCRGYPGRAASVSGFSPVRRSAISNRRQWSRSLPIAAGCSAPARRC